MAAERRRRRRRIALARGDELREVLLNVLENARLANARHVDVARRASDGDRVADRRRGRRRRHPDDVLPPIFEPHFSTRTSGSGLGLAISRRLVDAWGGAITRVERARARDTAS